MRWHVGTLRALELRYSLRTLVILLLLVTSLALWLQWGPEPWASGAVMKGHQDYVRSVAFSPDGSRIATASTDGTARVWDAASGMELAVMEGHGDRAGSYGDVYCVAFSPDGRRLVTGGLDFTVRVWDAVTGEQLALLAGHSDWINSVAFSANGSRVVTGSQDATCRIWDAATGRQIMVLKGHQDKVEQAEISSGGTRLVTSAQFEAPRLWRTTDGTCLAVLLEDGGPTTGRSGSFSPDSKHVVTGSDRARLWDAKTGGLIEKLKTAGNWEAIAWPPTGPRVVQREVAGVSVVDLKTGRQLTVLGDPEAGTCSSAISPDGRMVVTAGYDKLARVWVEPRPGMWQRLTLFVRPWLAALFGMLLLWSLWRDRRHFRDLAGAHGSTGGVGTRGP